MDKIKILQEEYKRTLLLMNYRTDKTLEENLTEIRQDFIFESDAGFATPQQYAQSTRTAPQESLRCNENEKNELLKMGWTMEESDTLEDMVTRDEGLVDALDGDTSLVGFTMDTDDAYRVADMIEARKSKMSSYKNEAGFYYPSIEVVRAFYSEDEGSETLYGELIDPPGYNSDKLTKILQPASINMLASYKVWIDHLTKIRGGVKTDPDKKKDEKKKEEGIKKGAIVVGGWKSCSGTYSRGCMSEKIEEVQGCLGGLVTDGKFGPKTEAAIKAKLGTTTFTDADIAKLCGKKEEKPDEDEDLDGEEPINI